MTDLTTTKTSGRPLALAPFQMTRLNPFSLMRRMSEEMDRMVGELSAQRGGNGHAITWAPAIEISQKDGAFVAKAELPGLKPDDVKVEIANDEIVIQGERVDEREENERGVHLTELQYGAFHRAIPLPEGAKAGEAKATFENGVLQVTVPVEEKQADRKSIPVQAASSNTGNKTEKAG
jgi:HSP20 family protein